MASVTDSCEMAPNCECGHGKMVVKIASKKAANPGRLYYKCPINDDHYKHFIWCDEFHARGRDRVTTSFVHQQEQECRFQPDYSASTARVATESNNLNDLRCSAVGLNGDMHIDIIFKGMILVLLGVLIGITMAK